MTQIASSAKSNYERFVCFVYRVITLSYFLIFLEIFRLNKILKHPKMTSCNNVWSWFKGFCRWLPSLQASPDNLFTNRMLPHWYERTTSVNKKWFEYISRRVQVKYIIKMYPIVFFPGSDECRKCPVFLLGLRSHLQPYAAWKNLPSVLTENIIGSFVSSWYR